MSTGGEMNDRIGQAYNAVMRDGTVPAIGREAVKDVRSTIMEFFFGKPERGSEPGTPLTPLYYDLVAARKAHGPETGAGLSQDKGPSMDAKSAMPTPSQVIDNPSAYLPNSQGQDNGNANDNAPARDAGPDRGGDTAQGHTGTTPTPSQVIDNPSAYLSEQQQQQGREQEHGREM